MVIKLEISTSGTYSEKEAISVSSQLWQLDSAEQYLNFFYQSVVKSHIMDSYNEAINQFLEAGRQRFQTEYALVARPVSESVYEVQAFSCGEEDRFYVGQHISTADFLCHRVIHEDGPCVVNNVAETGKLISPVAYNGLTVRYYAGIRANTHFATPSVVCFFSSNVKTSKFGEEERTILSQIADGIAYLVDQQKTQAQRKSTDSSMFANGSINTLDEYVEQAKIPELYGIPGRVVEVLKKRIGESPLSIGHVSEELNLSKRTLQRRLQQQSVNFAELRDQVRFHYSIDYLVKNQKSIDSISAALDFSDRTSFTNAFKRWTGLSPSTFRKLFRDYV